MNFNLRLIKKEKRRVKNKSNLMQSGFKMLSSNIPLPNINLGVSQNKFYDPY
jgi:hypothetical protein